MNRIDDLRDARIALQEGRFDHAEGLLAKFGASLAPGRSEPELREIAGELGQIRALSRAAAMGLALAREQVRQILGATRRLETYDRAGARQIEVTAASEVGRF